MKTIVCILIAISFGFFVHADKEISSATWDLSELFSNKDAWDREYDAVVRDLQALDRLKNTMGQNPSLLAEALSQISSLRSRSGKLAIYGFLVSDTNTNSESARRLYDAGTAIEPQVESAISFAAAEIRGIGKEKIDEWMKQDPRLEKHRARINRIFAEAPYSAGAEAQAIIDGAARWPRLSADLFWAIHESNSIWPQLSGKNEILNRASYIGLRRSPFSSERTKNLKQYLQSLKGLEDVFGLLYTRRIEADLVLARARKFKNGIDAIWLLRDGMPAGSWRTMVAVTNQHLDITRRYARLRNRALRRNQNEYSSLFVPPDDALKIPIDEAKQITLAASAPLGAEYVDQLQQRMNQRWMDLLPSENKRNTYAIWPPVGGAPPYVIMSYDGSYDSARRLTGAMTLMNVFANWAAVNPPDSRDDPGIYSNGIIYAGDLLHDDHAIRTAANSPNKIVSLIHALDLLRHHYFQGLISMEFDMKVQDLVDAGQPPHGAKLTQLYHELLSKYYEDEDESFKVPPEYGREWMIQSVPFLSYEHQFWPAAMALGCKIVERINRHDTTAQKAVYKLLGYSSFDRTYPMMLEVGIDMASEEPYLAVFHRMNGLLNQLERELQ